MKNENRLNLTQQKFLRACRNGNVMLPDLLAAMQIKPRLVARWLRRLHFREALGGVTVELRRSAWLQLDLMYGWALTRMAEMLKDKNQRNWLEMYLCRLVIEAYRDAMRLRLRRRKKAKKRAQTRTDLCHPDAESEREALLAVFRARDDSEG